MNYGKTILLFSLVVLSMIIVTPKAKADSVIYVPDNYSTIQEAINAAEEGDTIIVREGVYHENLVIDKPLTLKGVSKEDVILDGEGIEAHYGVHIIADGVVIRSFTIRGFTYGWGWGVQLTDADNCIVEDLKIIECNSGLNLYKGCDNNTIQYCEIIDIGGHGISIYGSSEGCTNNLIKENKIIGCAWYQPYGKYHLPAIPVFSGASDNVIEDNIVVGTGVGYGIALWGYTYGKPGKRSDMLETGNTIRNNIISNFDIGIYIRGFNPDTGTINLVSETEISFNTITYNRIGVKVKGFDASGSPGKMNYNNIENNTEYGVLNEPYNGCIYPRYDTTLNWWGDPTGPGGLATGAGDPVSDNVDFEPWLLAPFENYITPTVEGVVNILEGLKDGIEALDPEDFRKPGEKRKEPLIRKVDAVIRQVKVGAFDGAIEKLEKDIKEKIDVDGKADWLMKDSPLSRTLVANIDLLIEIIEMLER